MKLRHIRRRSKRSCFEKRKRASYSEWFILNFHVKIFEFRSRAIFTLQPLTANNVWISYEIFFLFFDENFCVSSVANITPEFPIVSINRPVEIIFWILVQNSTFKSVRTSGSLHLLCVARPEKFPKQRKQIYISSTSDEDIPHGKINPKQSQNPTKYDI